MRAEQAIKVLMFKRFDLIQKLKLSAKKIHILKKVIKLGAIKTSDLKDFGSSQSVSKYLSDLYKLNYLDRYEVDSKSGGIEYIYKIGDWYGS